MDHFGIVRTREIAKCIGVAREPKSPKGWRSALATMETERSAKTAILRQLRTCSEWLVRDDQASMCDEIDCSALLLRRSSVGEPQPDWTDLDRWLG